MVNPGSNQMPISRFDNPPGAFSALAKIVNDTIPMQAPGDAGGSPALTASQPIPKFVLGLANISDLGFLRNAQQTGWIYLISGDDPVAVAEVRTTKEGGAHPASISTGQLPQRLANITKFAEQQYGADPADLEPRLLEIPALYVDALWLHGAAKDLFFPIAMQGPPDKNNEDPDFLTHVLTSAQTLSKMLKDEGR
jgi:hypothetical protein